LHQDTAEAAELVAARREIELLRERLIETQAERDRLGKLLELALERRPVPLEAQLRQTPGTGSSRPSEVL
jgi:hypothetical protein